MDSLNSSPTPLTASILLESVYHSGKAFSKKILSQAKKNSVSS